jgi:tRNA(Ile)-lysidine synthase
MSGRRPLPRRVLDFTRQHDLVSEGAPLVVAVSGGPDSLCLLHVLVALRQQLGVDIRVAHLNHGLRGAESNADAEYVAGVAGKLGLPATVETRDVPTYRRTHRLSPEEAAREVRYAFLAEVAHSCGADTVAVGHTADDQIETILMHLIRGSGLSGLRGMRPRSIRRPRGGSELAVIRPLLETERAETESYCAAKGLSPRMDSSNQLPDPLRNQVRLQLLPQLREYNADIEAALLRAARAADADLVYIEEQVSGLWGDVVAEITDGISIDRAKFAGLHPSLRRHLLRSALQRLLGDLRDIEVVHIDSMVSAMSKPAGKRITIARAVMLHVGYDQGLLTTQRHVTCPLPPLDGERPLKVPGETLIGGWRVTTRIAEHADAQGQEDEFRACLDFDVTGDRLTVRGRRRGERFQPLGVDYEKKLQDFMVDAKIPRDWRDRVPLVCSPQHIVWVAGWRIDHRARVTPATKRVLSLEFERRGDLSASEGV